MKTYDAVALFSGGLDSILAIRLMQDQGLSILGLHFVSPFYGKPDDAAFWGEALGMDMELADAGEDMAALLASPPHGFGSVLNPCVDCKILMMRKAREYMQRHGARLIISGEVLGQRPMSQRRDSLNVISRDGEVRGYLLRPLCAKHMPPTIAEESGLVDREKLLGFSGRGRKEQLALAEAMRLPRIPAPAGGCMLTEKENARRYWPLLEKIKPTADDFRLSNLGRQLWQGDHWLSVGRDQSDNQAFQHLIRPDDVLLKIVGFPGPLALLRRPGKDCVDAALLAEAAALTASYSPKACRAHEAGEAVQIRLQRGAKAETLQVSPSRDTGFAEPAWDEVREKLHALRKQACVR